MHTIVRFACVLVALSVTISASPMPDYIFENWVKLTYCESIKKQAIYKREELENNCAAKVKLFENGVRKSKTFSLVHWQQTFSNSEEKGSFFTGD